MTHWNRFVYNIKHLVNAATALPGLDPSSISKKILIALAREKTSDKEEADFRDFIHEQNIELLVHFTHIDNLKNILSFGLIPRRYLEEETIRVALNPSFADTQRLDKITDANCLSISFPNYRMLHSKGLPDLSKWVILVIKPLVLEKHHCAFTANNAAKSGIKPVEGLKGARRMFSNLTLRRQNKLPHQYTTNPEAEVLEYAVVPPAWIREVHLYTSNQLRLHFLERLAARHNIVVRINPQLFDRRQDWKYWSKPQEFSALDDYESVRAHQRHL